MKDIEGSKVCENVCMHVYACTKEMEVQKHSAYNLYKFLFTQYCSYSFILFIPAQISARSRLSSVVPLHFTSLNDTDMPATHTLSVNNNIAVF